MKPMKRKWLWWVVALSTVAVLMVVCAVYLTSGYDADLEAIARYDASLDPEETVFGSIEAEVGFIFYPGGKVDHRAYAPLMDAVADGGILCVIAPMPADLAVLDLHAADKIRAAYPAVTRWIIGGHSLGGAMAAAHLDARPDAYDGLVLLGAYSTADLSARALDVLAVYGSEDRVMDAEKYAACLPNLPADMTELVIDGGCHAGFGLYGPQEGDGTPTITAAEQIAQTADAIAAMILN